MLNSGASQKLLFSSFWFSMITETAHALVVLAERRDHPYRPLAAIVGAICGLVTLGWLTTICARRWNESTTEMIGRHLLRIPQIRRKFEQEIAKVRMKEEQKVQAEWADIKKGIETRLGQALEPDFKFREKGYTVQEILNIFDVINVRVREKVAGRQFSGAIYPSGLEDGQIVYPTRAPGQSDLAYMFMVIQSQTYLWNTLHEHFSPVRFLQYWSKEMVAGLYGAEVPGLRCQQPCSWYGDCHR